MNQEGQEEFGGEEEYLEYNNEEEFQGDDGEEEAYFEDEQQRYTDTHLLSFILKSWLFKMADNQAEDQSEVEYEHGMRNPNASLPSQSMNKFQTDIFNKHASPVVKDIVESLSGPKVLDFRPTYTSNLLSKTLALELKPKVTTLADFQTNSAVRPNRPPFDNGTDTSDDMVSAIDKWKAELARKLGQQPSSSKAAMPADPDTRELAHTHTHTSRIEGFDRVRGESTFAAQRLLVFSAEALAGRQLCLPACDQDVCRPHGLHVFR